jgi:two-component system CheB/CheR fusion protein
MVEEPDNGTPAGGPEIANSTADGDAGDSNAEGLAGGGDSGPTLTVEPGAEESPAPALKYLVVGVGASAGGLQAFRQLLENLDPNTGMAFVLVTHLAPDQKSFLSEIVERYTQMPVKPVEDGERPLPNHLYVLQPNQSVTLRDGLFQVEQPITERFPKLVDKFFYSLAADQRHHAIGVVLSGADGDGALGLKSIKGEGGIALVQSPESATHSGMPRSSIASDHVDLVVPPAELAAELGRLAQQFARREVRSLEEESPDEEQAYQKILQLLRSVSGLDLRTYKPETIRRRISRRMLLLRIDRERDYLRFLQMRQDELRALQADVLISVTRFFRDPGFWESVRENVFPVLMRNRPQEKPVRVWCAGCSTGEEVYSLAILLLEYFAEHGVDPPLQIFGTDISEQAIETARGANYPETLLGL